MHPQNLEFDGAHLFHKVVGTNDAPWVVICHGAGLDHTGFSSLATKLSKRFRILLWDLPGHGKSQPMPDGFSAERCSSALKFLFDLHGIETAAILGFSFGGVVAQLFARRYPAMVHGFIAYGCLSPHLTKPLVPRSLVNAVVFARFGFLPWRKVRQEFSALCCRESNARTQVEQAILPLGKAGFLKVAAANLAATDYDPEFRMAGPVLVIAGAEDSNGAALWRATAAFEKAYPDASSVRIADAGHCAHLDRPSLFANAIDEFLTHAL